jgi:hypothetical protein
MFFQAPQFHSRPASVLPKRLLVREEIQGKEQLKRERQHLQKLAPLEQQLRKQESLPIC